MFITFDFDTPVRVLSYNANVIALRIVVFPTPFADEVSRFLPMMYVMPFCVKSISVTSPPKRHEIRNF